MILINRFKVTKEYTLGNCFVKTDGGVYTFVGVSIERGWLNNKKNISSIPYGEYTVRLEYSNRFKKDLWEIYGVPNRSECKFHSANYVRQLEGCIALGEEHIDIDGDKTPDVTNSRKTMKKFHKLLDGLTSTKLKINNHIEG